MSVLRPDVTRILLRWREAMAGSAVATLGLWLALTKFGALFLIGCGLVLFGAGLTFTGVRRAHRPADGGGLGVVEIDERQVIYLAPAGGGVVSLDRLKTARRVPDKGERFLWQLADADGNALTIPSDAVGAAALFDAIDTLPDIDARDGADGRILPLRRPPH